MDGDCLVNLNGHPIELIHGPMRGGATYLEGKQTNRKNNCADWVTRRLRRRSEFVWIPDSICLFEQFVETADGDTTNLDACLHTRASSSLWGEISLLKIGDGWLSPETSNAIPHYSLHPTNKQISGGWCMAGSELQNTVETESQTLFNSEIRGRKASSSYEKQNCTLHLFTFGCVTHQFSAGQ